MPAKSSVGWDRGFTGYITDNETGLLHARARQYSPTLGRFVSRDPWMASFIDNRSEKSVAQQYTEINWTGRVDYISSQMPRSRDGYQDGYGLYSGYFVPNATDPSGMHLLTCPSDYSLCTKIGYKPGANGCGPEGWKERLVPDSPFGWGFNGPCTTHDHCYGTCGSTQKSCDDGFLNDLEVVCYIKYSWSSPFPPDRVTAERLRAGLAACLVVAKIYYKAVSTFGDGPHTEGQKQACDCCKCVIDKDGNKVTQRTSPTDPGK